MASEHAPANMTDYIKHHLQHLQVQVPGTESQFFLINVDSVLLKLFAVNVSVMVASTRAFRAPST